MATLPAQSGQVWQRFLFHQKLSADSFLSDTLSVLWLFASLTHGITGDANLPAADSSDCSERRPKLSSLEGIRTRVRRAEIRGLNHYTKRAGFLEADLLLAFMQHCKKLSSDRRIPVYLLLVK